jgi:hypothetical protein
MIPGDANRPDKKTGKKRAVNHVFAARFTRRTIKLGSNPVRRLSLGQLFEPQASLQG